MATEGIEPPATVYIDDLDSSLPDGSVDEVRILDNHSRGIKNVLKLTFAFITGPVTATHTEINKLTGVIAGTVAASLAVVVDASKNIGTFATVTAATFVGNLTGNVTGNADTATNATNADTVTTIPSLSGDVTSVGNVVSIAANAIGTDEIAGDGVRFNNEIALGTAAGAWGMTSSASQNIPRGVYNMYTSVTGFSGTCELQIYVNSGWRTLQDMNILNAAANIISDGTNVRLVAGVGSGTCTVSYDEIFD